MRSAASLASLPVLSRITFCSCGGSSAASSRQSSTTSGASSQLNRWMRALAAAPDRADHGRMIVAKRRAHLARGEVEDLPAAVVVDVAAQGALDEERRKVADIADHVPLDRRLQLRAGAPASLPPALPGSSFAAIAIALRLDDCRR